MQNPFLESPNNLRKEWKKLRHGLTENLSDFDQLDMVVKWWSKCPTAKYWLDWDHPKTWPDPWELITTKNLDNSAISIGMEYTLLLSVDGRWTVDRIKMCLASDAERTLQQLVAVVDNMAVLGFNHARVVELNPNIIIHTEYKYDGKKHTEISK